MIQHTVLWKTIDMTPAERADFEAESTRRLNALVGAVPGLVSVTALADVRSTEGNWNFGLVSLHESAEALDSYQVHPDHVSFGGWFKPFVTARACVDTEL